MSRLELCCSQSVGEGEKAGSGEEKLAAVPKRLCLGNGISDICLADNNHHQI